MEADACHYGSRSCDDLAGLGSRWNGQQKLGESRKNLRVFVCADVTTETGQESKFYDSWVC